MAAKTPRISARQRARRAAAELLRTQGIKRERGRPTKPKKLRRSIYVGLTTEQSQRLTELADSLAQGSMAATIRLAIDHWLTTSPDAKKR